jgi:hypothetical protein
VVQIENIQRGHLHLGPTRGAPLAKGYGYEETVPSYDSLMETIRAARRLAQQVFSGTDVQQKASAAREILNQLARYYDPDAVLPGPATR